EEALHALEPAGLARVVARAAGVERGLELAQELLLLAGQADRRLDLDAAQQVARRATAYRGNTLAAQAEQLAGLGFRRQLEHYLAVDGRHFHLATEGGVDERYRHFAMQVVAVALEDPVLAHQHLHVQVAGRRAVHAGLTFTSQADAIAGINAGGNLHR